MFDDDCQAVGGGVKQPVQICVLVDLGKGRAPKGLVVLECSPDIGQIGRFGGGIHGVGGTHKDDSGMLGGYSPGFPPCSPKTPTGPERGR